MFNEKIINYQRLNQYLLVSDKFLKELELKGFTIVKEFYENSDIQDKYIATFEPLDVTVHFTKYDYCFSVRNSICNKIENKLFEIDKINKSNEESIIWLNDLIL